MSTTMMAKLGTGLQRLACLAFDLSYDSQINTKSLIVADGISAR
jgi:hypothetical protein